MREAAMNCPSCGAPMHLKPDADSFTCDYCRNVFLPEKDDDGVRVLGEPCAEICSVCNVALVHAAIGNIRIQYCGKCHGMAIPMGAFEALIEELRSVGRGAVEQPAPDPGDLHRKVDCPHCRDRMDAHYYAGPGNVIISSCERCSLNWLDRGQLMHIVRAPDGGEREPVFETALGDDDPTGTARWN
jgi:Zn-finger nucleic acid-binding protein